MVSINHSLISLIFSLVKEYVSDDIVIGESTLWGDLLFL